MEQTADEVRASTDDPAIRRRTLVWKINVIPALYRTLYNQRPLVALADTWALLIQAEQFLESPEGKRSLGADGSARILATVKELDDRTRDIARWALPDKDLAEVKTRITGWATRHPVPLTFATRETIEQYLATAMPSESLSAFGVAGQLGEDMTGVISRLDFLPTLVPRQATWQAELTYVDLIDPRLDLALTRGNEAIGKIDDMLTWLGTSGLDGFAKEQRIQIMRAVAQERVEIERLLERQRIEVQAFVEKERAEITATLRKERLDAMADAQAFADRTSAEAARQARAVVDHAILRIAILLAILLAGIGVIVLLARRRRDPAPPPAR
jgi:hypothetical protein